MLRATIIAALSLLTFGASTHMATAAFTTCTVPLTGGYHNCLSATNPSSEAVKAGSAAGTPYRFQLTRFSDGARWGWWEWNNTDYHIVLISISGTVTAQIDNRGSANASYAVELM